MYQYCLADIAKGLFKGMIGNYLLYFFQSTIKSGLPNILPDHINVIGKVKSKTNDMISIYTTI